MAGTVARNEEVERLLRREAEAGQVMEAEQAEGVVVAAEPEPTSAQGDAEEGVPPEQEQEQELGAEVGDAEDDGMESGFAALELCTQDATEPAWKNQQLEARIANETDLVRAEERFAARQQEQERALASRSAEYARHREQLKADRERDRKDHAQEVADLKKLHVSVDSCCVVRHFGYWLHTLRNLLCRWVTCAHPGSVAVSQHNAGGRAEGSELAQCRAYKSCIV